MLGWMRIHGRYDQAMTIFSEQADDLELFVLRAHSQPHALRTRFPAPWTYLDCGSDEHVHEAAERIEALEARYEWATGRADCRSLASLRHEDVEAALRAIERCAQRAPCSAGWRTTPTLSPSGMSTLHRGAGDAR